LKPVATEMTPLRGWEDRGVGNAFRNPRFPIFVCYSLSSKRFTGGMNGGRIQGDVDLGWDSSSCGCSGGDCHYCRG
jgi:hypothetical protein